MATNSFYEEYPIRCPSCGELICCRVPEYKELLKTTTVEEALNLMEVELYCSRSAFMNPSPNHLSMENRKVIEGLIPPDMINIHPDPIGLGGHPSFGGLSETQLASQKFLVTATPTITPQLSWTPQVAPGPARPTAPTRNVRPTERRGLFQQFIRQPTAAQPALPLQSTQLSQPAPLSQPSVVQPIIEPNTIKAQMANFLLPQLTSNEPEEFIRPTIPGVPVFNKSSAIIQEVDVGSGYTAQRMVGATYLAR